MARIQGRLAPGWNSLCWVHPVKKWVIYQNGSTGRLPDDAIWNAAQSEWNWSEDGIVPKSPDNPNGRWTWRGRPFSPGRDGGHLYAVPNEIRPGLILPYLLNDRTGEESKTDYASYLKPGWAWVRHEAGALAVPALRKLRKAHWELTGVPRPNVPEAGVPWMLGRLYPEWPPRFKGGGR